MPAPPPDSPDFVRLPTPRLIATLSSQPGGSGNVFGPFVASPASQGLLILFHTGLVGGLLPDVHSVSVSDYFGNTLLNWNPGPPQVVVPPFAFPYFQVVNKQFSVDVSWTAAPGSVQQFADVYELDTPPGGWVYAPPWLPLNVTLGVTSFAPLPVELDAANATVAVQGPAGWPAIAGPPVHVQPEVPGIQRAVVAPAQASGSAVVIAGTVGFTIRLYHISWSISTNAGTGTIAADIEDTNGGLLDKLRGDIDTAVSQVASPAHSIPYFGLPLPDGVGVRVVFASAVVIEADITVLYTKLVTP